MPTLPPTRVPVHYSGGSGSAPPTLPTPSGRSVVVGNAGGVPVPGFRFDGDATTYLDETVVARLEPEHCSITTDLTTLYASVRLSGGAATLLPDGARITGMVVICGGYASPHDFPNMSVDRDLFTDSLCVIGVDAAEGGSGLYYWVGPGELYRFPQTVQAPHLCLTQADGVFYVGTPHGVWSRTGDPTDTSSLWQRVGAFARRVVRIEPRATSGETPVLVLWALVQDKDAGGKTFHAIYRHPAYDGAASSPELEGEWQPIVRVGELHDMVASGPDDVWYVAKADPQHVHHVSLDSGAGTQTDTVMALPSGAQASHLSYVLGPPSHPASVVYASVAGAPSPLYASRDGGGGSWTAFASADPGGTLKDLSGNVVGINAIVASGLTFLGWTGGHLEGEVGQFVAAWACTTSGLFWTPALGSDGSATWKAVSGSSGLDDISIGNVAAGQYIHLLGEPANRVFVSNAERLYVSHTSTNLWEEAAPHATVTVGPLLAALAYKAQGRLIDNMVQTVGGMASSPIGNPHPNTHVQITTIVPDGWWWQRSLNAYRSFEWALVNGGVSSSTARTVQQQVSELSSESSSRVSLLTASGRLLETSIIFLGEHATARVEMTVQTTFTTQDAAARRLRASMKAPVRYHGQMLARSSTGEALGTTYLGLDDAELFVKSVKWEASSDLGPGACTCTCELSTNLAEDRDASAVASALLESLANHHKKHRR